jgi:hypothetical protein
MMSVGRPADTSEFAEQILESLPADAIATDLKRRADEAAGGRGYGPPLWTCQLGGRSREDDFETFV